MKHIKKFESFEVPVNEIFGLFKKKTAFETLEDANEINCIGLSKYYGSEGQAGWYQSKKTFDSFEEFEVAAKNPDKYFDFPRTASEVKYILNWEYKGNSFQIESYLKEIFKECEKKYGTKKY